MPVLGPRQRAPAHSDTAGRRLFSQPKLTGISRRRLLLYAHLLIGRRALGLGHLLRRVVIAPGLTVDTLETAGAHGTYCPPPVELLVNGVRNPLAVDNDALRLTWMIPLAGRRQIQAAYRILVSSSPELLADGHADQWDSGKVDSAQSSGCTLSGRFGSSRFAILVEGLRVG